MADGDGLISRKSAHDASETARRFKIAVADAGQMVFAEIDHGAGAASVHLPLRPTLLILFGHPRGGTPLMQIRQTAGIDLPLKALVWTDAAGATWLTWNDPHWLAGRHDLGPGAEAAVAAIRAGMDKLAAEATT